jgi:hypothetical protein
MKTDEISARGKPITNRNRVEDIVRKFKSKYGEGGSGKVRKGDHV